MEKKRLLFLDDTSGRWQALQAALPKNISFTYWTLTAQDAIEAMNDTFFDVVCLDHDLGENKTCGCAVIDFVVKNRDCFEETQFIIHSWNPDGARVMNEALVKAGLKSKIKPFKFTEPGVD